MATKLDSNKLVIGLKKEFKKSEFLNDEKSVESAIKKIHLADEKEKNIEDKSTKRITLDIEKPLHRKIVNRLLDKDVTFREYFLDLAKKDLDME